MISFNCALCDERVLLDKIEDHVRIFHPDHYEPLERWPDGNPVIIDDTLEPEEFEGER